MRNNEDRFGVDNKLQGADPLESLLSQNKSEVTENSLNFIVPTEFISLPSKGKFYTKDHPLHGKEDIEVKQMTAKEEDILTSKSLLKKGVALDKLIQSLVVDKRINHESLTIEDRNAILINARISAYGPEYATQVTCPSCYEKVKYKFDLLNEVEKIEEDSESKISNLSLLEDGTFIIKLPSTKWDVQCRVLTGKDEKTLIRLSELKKKSNDNDSILIEQLKLMVVSIKGVTDPKIIAVALDSMPARDSKYLRNEYQKLIPSVDLTQEFVCSKCDNSTQMEVPLSADFFWFK